MVFAVAHGLCMGSCVMLTQHLCELFLARNCTDADRQLYNVEKVLEKTLANG